MQTLDGDGMATEPVAIAGLLGRPKSCAQAGKGRAQRGVVPAFPLEQPTMGTSGAEKKSVLRRRSSGKRKQSSGNAAKRRHGVALPIGAEPREMSEFSIPAFSVIARTFLVRPGKPRR